MKTFWIIMALLAAITVAISLRSGRRNEAPPNDQPSPAMNEQVPVNQADNESRLARSRDAVEQTAARENHVGSTTAETSAEKSHDTGRAESPDKETVPAMEELDAALEEETDPIEDSKHTTARSGGDQSLGLKIDRRPDGSLLLDDRFVVRGAGTAQKPYLISWELLVSAEETYAPNQDMYEMPPRIEFLNGKHVLITGFMFTALLEDETSELLVMRNMWDGCCVGLPPSSYDAIEVALRRPIQIKGMGLLESGVLSGVLRVDPYVKDNWLLGLYIMEDGVIDFGDL